MLVNHVLSSSLPSNIFSAIFTYFRKYAPEGARVEVSTEASATADIVHYHRPQLESSLRNPCVVTVHHDLQDANPAHSFATYLDRYRQAARVVCLNRAQQRLLAAAGLTSTTVIPHGYNDEVLHLRGDSSFSCDPLRIGFFSNRYRTRFKGEAYLGELAKRLSPAHFEFTLVGQGRGQTAGELAQLGYSIRLFEHLPYRLFQELYESIDYLLMCSNFEGGPANLPEALATGTPVLCSPVGFAPELVADGENGLLLSFDANHDAQRISRLAGNSNELAQMRQCARERAADTPTWRDIVRRHFELYEAILSGEVQHA
jgi:glycosyltransferase involved in cell wall biosynthesis